MLHSESTLKGFPLKSRDGDIGTIKDLYFDDRHWAIRYLVAETGKWLPQRKVLLSPYSLGGVQPGIGSVEVNLTQKQIEDSPSLNSDEPVSRQFEELYHDYYKWPAYWVGPYAWGAYPVIMRDPQQRTAPVAHDAHGDPDLRSANDVRGHHVQANDGEVGHISDFLFDDATWIIRYLVINTSNWWPSKKVLLSPAWIDRVSWPEAKVFVDANRDLIKDAPSYDPEIPVNREYEARLHLHYQRSGYWSDDLA